MAEHPVAPALAAVAKRLERNLIVDNLNQRLYNRADPASLGATVTKGGNVAPRLRKAKAQLEQQITKDQLGRLLESRPDPDELVRSGILHAHGAGAGAGGAGGQRGSISAGDFKAGAPGGTHAASLRLPVPYHL